jgi:CheY-like chemotaxis protein
LPLRTMPSEVDDIAAPPPSAEIRRRVLIADDNQDSAVSLSMLLDSLGHETKVVYDGGAAVEAAEIFRPDVAIVDLDMPRLNGYQVARMLKEQGWATQILLIAMTGWAQEPDRERGRQAGFHAHLVKPVALDALQRVFTEGHEAASLNVQVLPNPGERLE